MRYLRKEHQIERVSPAVCAEREIIMGQEYLLSKGNGRSSIVEATCVRRHISTRPSKMSPDCPDEKDLALKS